jgi:hypothetical protein
VKSTSVVRWLAAYFILVSAPAWAGRFAIIVGNNLGSGMDTPLRFAETDADRLHEVLTELGGFAPDHIELLKSPGADSIEGAFDRTRSAIQMSGDKSALLVFFYSGHADGSSLRLGSGTVSLERVRELLARSGATVRVGVLDACGTGAMTSRPKGIHRGEPFLLSAPSELATTGQVIIAAVSDTELAQESDALQGSFFSTYLVSALRGAADRLGTGRVTLNDAYRYTYDQTVRATLLSRSGAQHPSYAVDLSGQGDLVLTEPKRGQARLSFRSDDPGEFVVFTPQQTLVAELYVDKGSDALLALEPGDYDVQKRTESGLRFARVRVESGQERELREARMQTLQFVPLAKKGGSLRLTGELAYSLGDVSNKSGSPLVRAGVDLDLGRTLLSPRLTFGYTQGEMLSLSPYDYYANKDEAPLTETQWGGGAAWTYPWEWSRLEVRAGGAVDILAINQFVFAESHVSPALKLAGVLSAGWRLGSGGVLLSLQLEPGLEWVRESSGPSTRPFFLAGIGIHYDL